MSGIANHDDIKKASILFQSLKGEYKDEALKSIAKELAAQTEYIKAENLRDLEAAKARVENGELSSALYSRLKLDENKIRDMISGVNSLASMPDPVNKRVWGMQLDNGLDLYKVSCPIGVIATVFEARPDVVVQIGALAIKTGNVVIMKGGSEAVHTNRALYNVMLDGLKKVQSIPENIITLIESRSDVSELLKMDDVIDLIIPRGGSNFVKWVMENTKIPVLGHASGICHIYVDESADLAKAEAICLDAKIQYPSACNAVETVLINKNVLDEFLPRLVKTYKENSVEIRADEFCIAKDNSLIPAADSDWSTEYSEKIVSLKVVNDISEAVFHINKYGSGHTDSIIAEDEAKITSFMNNVDSADVFANASTRFADGFRYGLGAEVGISTNKIHARGPVGLDGLTIYRYQLFGNGQIVKDYCDGTKTFIHKRLM